MARLPVPGGDEDIWGTILNSFLEVGLNPDGTLNVQGGNATQRTSTISLRGDTAANWATHNAILLNAEFGVETDTLRYKVGDGVTPWNALNYATLLPLNNLGDLTNVIVAKNNLGTNLWRIVYNGNAYPSRPPLTKVPAGYAEYIGPVEPSDWVSGDTWVQTI